MGQDRQRELRRAVPIRGFSLRYGRRSPTITRMLPCHHCGLPADPAPAPTGRPWKHRFCDRHCYARWRAGRHLALKSDWLRIQREVWGTSEIGRREVGKSREVGRRAEVLARDTILPSLGFTEITDMSGLSNQFYVDFVATLDGRRVLVDATIKLKGHIPEKVTLATALRMPLYILHVSPSTDGLFWLNGPITNAAVSRVPAAFIRSLRLPAPL